MVGDDLLLLVPRSPCVGAATIIIIIRSRSRSFLNIVGRGRTAVLLVIIIEYASSQSSRGGGGGGRGGDVGAAGAPPSGGIAVMFRMLPCGWLGGWAVHCCEGPR